MQIKLTNKFEAKLNNKTYLAYNTVFPKTFEQIKNYLPYTKYLAVGGTLNEEYAFENRRLYNLLGLKETINEELQLDASEGVLFSKKSININSSDFPNQNIFEVGFSSSDNSGDYELCNYAKFVDENGDPDPIVRNVSVSDIEIVATVYLEFSIDSTLYPTTNENNLLKLLLGEGVTESMNFEVAKGTNYSANAPCLRGVNSILKSTAITSTSCTGDSATLTFSGNVGEGEVDEVVLFVDSVPAFRRKLRRDNPQPFTKTYLHVSGSGSSVQEDCINTITSVSYDGASQTFMPIPLFDAMGDYSLNIFPMQYSKYIPRFQSKDGNKLAFVRDGAVDIYEEKDYQIKKINTDSLSSIGAITNIIMDDEECLIIRSVEPKLLHFRFENDILVQKVINLDGFFTEVGWSNFAGIDFAKSESGEVIIGIFNSDETQYSYKISLDIDEEHNWLYNSCSSSNQTNTCYIAGFSERDNVLMSLFFCTHVNTNPAYNYGGFRYFQSNEWFTAAGALTGSYVAHQATYKHKTLKAGILSYRNDLNPTITLYYMPEKGISQLVRNYENSRCYVSNNMRVVYRKDPTLEIDEFDALGKYLAQKMLDIPSEIKEAGYADIDFIGNYILIWTESGDIPLFAIPLEQNQCFVKFPTTKSNKEVTVVGEKYNRPGITAGSTVNVLFTIVVT